MRTSTSATVAVRSKPAASACLRSSSSSAFTEAGTRTEMVRSSLPSASTAPSLALLSTEFLFTLCKQELTSCVSSSALVWTRKGQVLGHHHVEFVTRPDVDRRRPVHAMVHRLLAEAAQLFRSCGPGGLAGHRPLIGLVIAIRSVGPAATKAAIWPTICPALIRLVTAAVPKVAR